MKYAVLLLLVSFVVSFAQAPSQKGPEEITLPNGKKWSDAIAEADHQSDVKDARALAALTVEIRDDIEAGDKFVLSLKTLRKIDDADKILKKLGARMRKN